MKPPFPYFGGKSRIAHIVWSALGQPKHYIEPFFGSGAVLLARLNYNAREHVETVCDKDGFLCNVWRSMQFNPAEVARWCDWPVNHGDLMARKKELIKNEERLLENLINNPDWYDAKLAGYWIWAASCWIGSGLTRPGQIPRISNGLCGVHAVGLRPHLSNGGYNTNIYEWFRALSERLRYVRVVCGDWTRVCGGNWQNSLGDVGIFFDPPYGIEDRDTSIYHHESTSIAKDVTAWCIERGKLQSYRIVIAGYEEQKELLDRGWYSYSWSSVGGYSNISTANNTQGKKNKYRETLYFSPNCLNYKQKSFL